MNIKDRLTTGWTGRRVLYILLGVTFIGQAIAMHQYEMIIFGAYFASMGVFAFGCAGGNCTYQAPSASKTISTVEE